MNKASIKAAKYRMTSRKRPNKDVGADSLKDTVSETKEKRVCDRRQTSQSKSGDTDNQPDSQTALPLGVYSHMLVEDAIVKIEKELTTEHIVTLQMDFNSSEERTETRRRLTKHFQRRVHWEDDNVNKTLKYPCVLQVMFFSKEFSSLGDDPDTREPLLSALQTASWNAGIDNATDTSVLKTIVANAMSKRTKK